MENYSVGISPKAALHAEGLEQLQEGLQPAENWAENQAKTQLCELHHTLDTKNSG